MSYTLCLLWTTNHFIKGQPEESHYSSRGMFYQLSVKGCCSRGSAAIVLKNDFSKRTLPLPRAFLTQSLSD